MLAALLLNLADYQERRQGGVSITVNFSDRRESLSIREAARKIEDLLGGLEKAQVKMPSKARIKRTTKKVVEVLTEPEIEVGKLSNAQSELGVLLFDMRRSLDRVADTYNKEPVVDLVLYFEALQVMLDEDEAVALLLLSL